MASPNDHERQQSNINVKCNEESSSPITGVEDQPECSSAETLIAGPSKEKTDVNQTKECKPKDEEKTPSPLSESGSDDGQRARKRERREEDRETQSSPTSSSFPRLWSRPRNRRYRNHHSSASSSDEEGLSSRGESPDSEGNALRASIMALVEQSRGLDSDDTWSLIDSDDSDSDLGTRIQQDVVDTEEEESEENMKYQTCLQKENPKHKWCVTTEVLNRQIGVRTQQQAPELFWQRCYSSLHCVKRLELMYKLNEHHGCVNSVSFNRSGTRLASGSDDRHVIVWDWAIGQSVVSYSTGHSSNVFHTKFLPLSGDTHMVSCARDGQVRLAVLSSTGECRSTKRLASHRKAANKLSLIYDTPHTFLSSGEDALVMAIDVRSSEPENILYVKEDWKRIGLYCVDSNPLNKDEFCVCGMDYFIRIYDRRNLKESMKKFRPHHIVGSRCKFTTVTCAMYNHDGTEIVASYSDENIYLFDSRHNDGADFVHKYEGHRNNATVKSCAFFGPKSEYVISGSDCGNIFFWDKNTEAIVQFLRGDEKGVVNALVGHPQLPILASSGLDSDVKIWVPSCEQDSQLKNLRKVVIKNMRDRVENPSASLDIFERHVDWDQALRHIRLRTVSLPEQMAVRSTAIRRRRDLGNSDSSDDTDSDSSHSSTTRLQCPPS